MRPTHFPGFMPWTMNLGCLLLLALAIALLVFWLVKRRNGDFPKGAHHHGWHPTPPPFAPQPPSAALQVLDERLARGDIDVDDYLTRRAALLGDRPNGSEFRPAPPAPEQPRTDSPEGGNETA